MKNSFQIKREFLKNIVIFSGFRSKSIYYLTHKSEEKVVLPNEIIIEQGSAFSGLIILVDGFSTVSKVIKRKDPHEFLNIPKINCENFEEMLQISLVRLLPECVFGWIERQANYFRVVNTNTTSRYLYISFETLKETLDVLEMSKLKLFFAERTREYQRFLLNNIFYKDLVAKSLQNENAQSKHDLYRKPAQQQYFRIKSKKELQPLATKMMTEGSKSGKLGFLPLDFVGQYKSNHSKKPIKMETINVKIVRKSINKLKMISQKQITPIVSRYSQSQALFRKISSNNI